MASDPFPPVNPAADAGYRRFEPVGVGSVLEHTLAVFKKAPAVFFGLAAAAAVIPCVLEISAVLGGSIVLVTVARILDFLFDVLIQGAATYAVYKVLKNETPAIGDSMSRGLSNLVTLVLASILVSIGVFAGMILLIVPGVLLALCWCMTIPACAAEGLGVMDGLSRSSQLTRGKRLTIFLLGLVLFVAIAVVAYILPHIFGAFFFNLFGHDNLVAAFVVHVAVVTLVLCVPTAFLTAMNAVLYFDLRQAREGIPVAEMPNLFR